MREKKETRCHGPRPARCRFPGYEEFDENTKLVINLRDLGHTIRFLFEGRGSQNHILIVLKEHKGTITQQLLTKELCIQPGSASEVLGKLETAGLITRTPDEKDHRTMQIRLTKEGQHQAEEALARRVARHEKMFSSLTDEEKKTLLSLAEKLNIDWEKFI